MTRLNGIKIAITTLLCAFGTVAYSQKPSLDDYLGIQASAAETFLVAMSFFEECDRLGFLGELGLDEATLNNSIAFWGVAELVDDDAFKRQASDVALSRFAEGRSKKAICSQFATENREWFTTRVESSDSSLPISDCGSGNGCGAAASQSPEAESANKNETEIAALAPPDQGSRDLINPFSDCTSGKDCDAAASLETAAESTNKNEAEDAAWASTDKNSLQSLEAYLSSCSEVSDCRHRKQAYARIDFLRKQDQLNWSMVNKQDISSITQYIDNCKNGSDQCKFIYLAENIRKRLSSVQEEDPFYASFSSPGLLFYITVVLRNDYGDRFTIEIDKITKEEGRPDIVFWLRFCAVDGFEIREYQRGFQCMYFNDQMNTEKRVSPWIDDFKLDDLNRLSRICRFGAKNGVFQRIISTAQQSTFDSKTTAFFKSISDERLASIEARFNVVMRACRQAVIDLT